VWISIDMAGIGELYKAMLAMVRVAPAAVPPEQS